MKQIKIFILLVIFIFSITGCRMISHEALAVKLLNKKYNDSFEVEKVQSRNTFGGYYTVIAYQEDNPDMLFEANVNFDGSGVSDNYVSKIVSQKLSDKIAHNLNDLKGTYYIYSNPMIQNRRADDVDMSVQEFLEAFPVTRFSVKVYYKPEDTSADEIYEELNNMFKDIDGVNGQVKLYFMGDYTLGNVQYYIKTHDDFYNDYKHMVEQYFVGNIDIENSRITNTKEEIILMIEEKGEYINDN